MSIARRRFLRLALGATALPAFPLLAAEDYPARPVHIIVGFPPGGGVDTTARLMGQRLSERLGRPFVIENRVGAASNIATEFVVRSPADGYTLLLVASTYAINATLNQHLDFSFIRDIAPVAGIIDVPNIMVVHPSFPARTVPEFIAYAKANPGKLNFGSAGTGTTTHLCGELFKMMTGVDMLHVPYRGMAPALTDVMGGQVQLSFATAAGTVEFARAGKLRALAVTTETRTDLLPDVPAVTEFVPGFAASTWYGVGAPRETPAAIIGKLNAEVNAALADPEMRKHFADLVGTVLPGSPAEFGAFIAAETDKWAKVIHAANIKIG
jgi:tripartite-type tricarboxylate transporter receptor subunit TctC